MTFKKTLIPGHCYLLRSACCGPQCPLEVGQPVVSGHHGTGAKSHRAGRRSKEWLVGSLPTVTGEGFGRILDLPLVMHLASWGLGFPICARDQRWDCLRPPQCGWDGLCGLLLPARRPGGPLTPSLAPRAGSASLAQRPNGGLLAGVTFTGRPMW